MSKRLLTGGVAALLLSGVCFAAEGSGGGAGDDRAAKIKDALSRLDTSEDSQWTQGGLPSVDHMKALTGLDDLKREEIGNAVPGFSRENAKSAPSDLKNAGQSDAAKNAGPSDEARSIREPHTQIVGEMNVEAGLQGNDAENEAARLEGEAAEQNEAEAGRREATLEDVADIAKHIKNPIVLIEAAMVAMNADDRYRKNGELQTFMRAYSIQQTNIKAHQSRLDKRFKDAEEAAAKSAS